MFAKRWLAPVALFAALASVVGCSRAPSGTFATVSGTVTHNGAPVEAAQVVFHSTVEVGGKRGTSFGAQTDSSGKYLIATVGKDPGIPPGMYKVTITKLDAKSSINLPKDFDQGQMEASGMARNLMPKDYEDPNRTKLSVTLEAGKNENKNFDLKGQASNTARPMGVP
jgi:hypothetical protein